MNEILVLTVGMSTAPLINCIRSRRPERVVFLCSEGTRSKVDEVLDAVPIPRFDEMRDVVVLSQRQSRKDQAVINELDRLDCVYTIAWELLQRLRREEQDMRISVDYTGGSKTMAAGLAMAAVDDGRVQLLLTTTEQRPTSGEVSGATVPMPTPFGAIQVCRLLDRELVALLNRYDYAAAAAQVHRVRTELSGGSDDARRLLRLEHQLQALDAWDRFDHRQAQISFDQITHDARSSALLRSLRLVVGSRGVLDPLPSQEKWPMEVGHRLEAVEDLLRNAERRASQERYDDAVGRLYRAMELCEQLLLKVAVTEQVGKAGIDTGAVEIHRLPTEIQPQWREMALRKGAGDDDAPLKLGLADAYDLLADLGHPTGLSWRERRSEMVNVLKIRNHSLFAHGFSPVGYSGWRQLSRLLQGFLNEAIAHHRAEHHAGSFSGHSLPQLPSSLEDM